MYQELATVFLGRILLRFPRLAHLTFYLGWHVAESKAYSLMHYISWAVPTLKSINIQRPCEGPLRLHRWQQKSLSGDQEAMEESASFIEEKERGTSVGLIDTYRRRRLRKVQELQERGKIYE